MLDTTPLFFLSFALLVQATRRRENVFPETANPRGQIICDFGGGNIQNQRALEDLQLCAKPQYGGGIENIGGYCGYNLRPRQLAFDNSPISWTVEWLSSAYWQNYCQNRCRCKRSLRRHKPWPVLSPRYRTDIISLDAASSLGSFIRSDDKRRFVHPLTDVNNRCEDSALMEESSVRIDDSDMTAEAEEYTDSEEGFLVYDSAEEYDMPEGFDSHADSVLTLKAPIANQTELDPDESQPMERWISLSKSNYITCSGDLPDWLPRDLDPSSHMDGATCDTVNAGVLQQLCATALSGGNPNANAGGVCSSHLNGRSYVRFLDAWAGTTMLTTANLRHSAAVRTYCFLHCRCLDETQPTTRYVPSGAVPAAPWYGTAEIAGDRTGMVARFIDRDGLYKAVLLAPYRDTQGRTHHRPSSCPINQDGLCINDPPISAVREQQQSTISTCGGSCHSSAECSGSLKNPCRCAVDLSKVMTIGLDRVFGISFCLAQMAVQINPNLKLGGRDELPMRACACNSTYISFGCCGSENGIIWESEESRLGRLNLDP